MRGGAVGSVGGGLHALHAARGKPSDAVGAACHGGDSGVAIGRLGSGEAVGRPGEGGLPALGERPGERGRGVQRPKALPAVSLPGERREG